MSTQSLVARAVLVSLATSAVLFCGSLRAAKPPQAVSSLPVSEQEQLNTFGKAPSRELAMQPLPGYRIEPPDVIQIEMLKLVPLPPYRADVFDVLQIRANALPDQPIDNYYMVEAEGTISLGSPYGSVHVEGMTLDEIGKTLNKRLQEWLRDPAASVQLARVSGTQPVTGQYLVAPDGTINLRQYGQVAVTGKTVAEARLAIQRKLAAYLKSPELSVDVIAYNSKAYYLVTRSGSAGDSVRRLPVTGNETVLDAISQADRPMQLDGKKIWIARPSASDSEQGTILPVDWDAITSRGATATNYQLLPGDRLFIADNKPPEEQKVPSEIRRKNGGPK